MLIPLQQLPLIGVLYLFQSIIRHAYSYEYFYPAIEESIVNILSDNSLEQEVKMYSIFFISTILIELGKENPFDGLIDSFGDKLPFPIQFGILYESDNIEKHSKVLKKQEKHLDRILKHSGIKLRNYIEQIHTKPLKRLAEK